MIGRATSWRDGLHPGRRLCNRCLLIRQGNSSQSAHWSVSPTLGMSSLSRVGVALAPCFWLPTSHDNSSFSPHLVASAACPVRVRRHVCTQTFVPADSLVSPSPPAISSCAHPTLGQAPLSSSLLLSPLLSSSTGQSARPGIGGLERPVTQAILCSASATLARGPRPFLCPSWVWCARLCPTQRQDKLV
ncbi:unnamed protein product [Protopolystoma xenopodis]|uniref:Uncharacterized protein n=1 Tax=Protopolystoma xenopodis TaxID=117903 RepID=A0A3S5B5R4_9PLAT|nr:unnamed protein product [Protopolystoma xenopodis]